MLRYDQIVHRSNPISSVPGLVPGTHGSWQGACRGPWMPTDLVRGLKAHGSSPAKTRECLGLSTGGVSLPDPVPGLVIRYSYLWKAEYGRGQEEGVKDRPCAVILVSVDDGGDRVVTVLPISHAVPLILLFL